MIDPHINVYGGLVTAIRALVIPLVLLSTPAHAERPQDEPWKEFVSVAGQPEPVPAQWVSTPEGKLAHSIVIPNPVPKGSGYRWWMSSERYFEHLCRTEAGEFIFKTVDNVEGFYFARPPKRPTDSQLMARYKLEAPGIERTFQLMPNTPEARAKIFVGPPYNRFRYVEENDKKLGLAAVQYVKSSGFQGGVSPMKAKISDKLSSSYSLAWRGIRRDKDRELGIAGGEWLVIDLRTQSVLGVMRDYVLTGNARGTTEGIWWLSAVSCPVFAARYSHISSERIYDFASNVLRPN